MKFFKLLISVLMLAGCVTINTKDFVVDENTIQVVGFLDRDLMGIPYQQLKSTKEDTLVYIYFNSTGGNPMVFPEFLDLMKNRTTVCLADRAFGPSFTLFQACNYRLVHKNSVVGQGKIIANPTGNAKVDAEYSQIAENLAKQAELVESKALGMSSDDYEKALEQNKIMFTDYNAIISNNAADNTTRISCSEATADKVIVRNVFVGTTTQLSLVMTMCPFNRRLIKPAHLSGSEVGEIIGIPMMGNKN